MANSKDNISKYATSFIGFDEASGDVYDSIGGYVGTLYNTPTRVTGWNGEGYAMSFDGSNQYVLMNDKVIPIGAKSIRFKLKPNSLPTTFSCVLDNRGWVSGNSVGWIALLRNDGTFDISYWKDQNTYDTLKCTTSLDLGVYNDILLTFDGTTAKLYCNDMTVPKDTKNITTLANEGSINLHIGSANLGGTLSNYFDGQLDQIEIYDRVISPIPDKHLVLHNGQYKYHNGTSWLATTATEANFIQYGHDDLSHITEAQWAELTGNKSIAVWSDFEDKQYVSAVLEKEPFVAKDIIGDNAELILHTESTSEQLILNTEVDNYSVYDYISELPTVLVYTESTDDIIVSTTTEPFDLYDEFGDEVEVLFYTDDEAVTEADLILEANWSPIDELEGDFEVVTWTDEGSDTAQRVLELTAIPKPQFVKLANPKLLYGYLESILAEDVSETYRFKKDTRYLLTDQKGQDWYVWDKYSQSFVKTDASTHEAIIKNGMTDEDINNITDKQWKTWKGDYVNIGVFLKDNPRDTIVSIVESISYSDYLPRHSTQVEKGSFYILNTTAKIDLELNGNVIKGILSDDDLTRVQYRVFVNNKAYYPSDGSFTELGDSPRNIELVIPSKDIIMDDWNTVKVEFQDFYGTTDYWQTQFIGTYSGLMFKDIHGDYYSSEIGEVLKYLDFGVIIAGQTTIEHEIILKNQYGYDVENIYLYANTSEFPQGMSIEFSESLSPFLPQPELKLARVLKNNEEYPFFVRLKTELGSTPNANGSFDIIVRADKV